MTAIQLEHLFFGYRKDEFILNDVNLTVPKGSIYGFLGANGAGKTTSLRLVLGLLKAQRGTIYVNGTDTKQAYPEQLRTIGSMIENASLYPHLSAKDNLRIWSKYFNISTQRIDEVLELVSLTEAKKKKTEAFSTGMKQRLGLAIALLHDPEILILDEPTNGLDPLGIIDLRNLLHRLRDEGKTILLSSHMLTEVEKLVTRIGILKDGKIVFEGSMNELQALKQQNLEILLRVDEQQKAFNLIDAKYQTQLEDRYIKLSVTHERELPVIVKKLVGEGIAVYEIIHQRSDLEKLFLSVNKEL